MIIIINNHYDSSYNRWTPGSGFVRLARAGGWAEGETANRFGEDSRDTGGSIGINFYGGAGDSDHKISHHKYLWLQQWLSFQRHASGAGGGALRWLGDVDNAGKKKTKKSKENKKVKRKQKRKKKTKK